MNRILLFKRLCSTTLPKNVIPESAKKFQRIEVTPIALQYLYEGSTKVQTQALESPKEIEVSGITVDPGSSEKPIYPFAIYDSLEEAKNESDNGKETKQPRGRGRRFSIRKSENNIAEEENTLKEDVDDKAEVKVDEEYFRYGTVDPSIPPSKVPCSGCGARLHCQDSKLPGFLPWEVFRKIRKNSAKMRKTPCQRCTLIRDYNVALKMNVKAEDYPKVISHLKKKKAIVILVVDLTDFPGSVWPNILELIGTNKRVILVGNKVDLLPQDSFGYISTIQDSMVRTFKQKCKTEAELDPKLLDSILVSARTGFNIEKLITMVFKHWKEREKHLGGDIYLVGTTNVGKSSIFNALLDSDLCDAKALNRIDKATIAPVPGTTLNLLKFPIMRPEPGRLSMRYARLRDERQVFQQMERERIDNLRKYKSWQVS